MTLALLSLLFAALASGQIVVTVEHLGEEGTRALSYELPARTGLFLVEACNQYPVKKSFDAGLIRQASAQAGVTFIPVDRANQIVANTRGRSPWVRLGRGASYVGMIGGAGFSAITQSEKFRPRIPEEVRIVTPLLSLGSGVVTGLLRPVDEPATAHGDWFTPGAITLESRQCLGGRQVLGYLGAGRSFKTYKPEPLRIWLDSEETTRFMESDREVSLYVATYHR